MPDSCCAVDCTNMRGKEKKLCFYRIPFGSTPESKRRRELWVNAIKRKNWPDEKIDNARICSEHFISGKLCSYNLFLQVVFQLNFMVTSTAS